MRAVAAAPWVGQLVAGDDAVVPFQKLLQGVFHDAGALARDDKQMPPPARPHVIKKIIQRGEALGRRHAMQVKPTIDGQVFLRFFYRAIWHGVGHGGRRRDGYRRVIGC